MSKAKHTPGPWYIGRHSSQYEHEIHDGKPFGRIGTVISNNAHLIAAAPEMLKALEDVVHHLGDTGAGAETRDNILLLIAKAKGEV